MITNLVGAGENCCVHNYNEELQNANILLFCLFSAPACWRGRQTRPGQASVNSSHSLLSPLLSSTNTRLMSCSHRHQAYWLPTSRIVLLNCLLIPRRVRWDYDLSIFLWLLNVQKGCKNYLTLWCCLTVWERLCCCWSSRVPSSSDKISSPVTDKKSPLHDFIVPTIHHLIENIQ